MIQIRELGDAPVKNTRLKRNYSNISSGFHIGNVSYEFTAHIEDDYPFKKIKKGIPVWEIQFTADGSWDVTGTGNAALVFSTIKKILGNFLNISKPVYWFFDARKNEPSREKLYNFFAKTIEKHFPKYEFIEEIENMHSGLYYFHYYLFKRK